MDLEKFLDYLRMQINKEVYFRDASDDAREALAILQIAIERALRQVKNEEAAK